MGVLDRLNLIDDIAKEILKQLDDAKRKRFLKEYKIPAVPIPGGSMDSIKYLALRMEDTKISVLKKMAVELKIDISHLPAPATKSKTTPVKSKSQPVKPREPFRPASDFATAPAVKPATPLPSKSDNNSLIARVFISHSTKNKQYANTLRKVFKRYGIIAFVSDEDIKGGEVWRKRIRKEIKEMHVFIAMHTDDFSKSLWCQQETGLALAREPEVEIIPINFNKEKPLESFLDDFQYIKRGTKSTAKIVTEILDRLKTSDKTKELYFAKIADKVKIKDNKDNKTGLEIFTEAIKNRRQAGMNLGKRPDELV